MDDFHLFHDRQNSREVNGYDRPLAYFKDEENYKDKKPKDALTLIIKIEEIFEDITSCDSFYFAEPLLEDSFLNPVVFNKISKLPFEIEIFRNYRDGKLILKTGRKASAGVEEPWYSSASRSRIHLHNHPSNEDRDLLYSIIPSAEGDIPFQLSKIRKRNIILSDGKFLEFGNPQMKFNKIEVKRLFRPSTYSFEVTPKPIDNNADWSNSYYTFFESKGYSKRDLAILQLNKTYPYDLLNEFYIASGMYSSNSVLTINEDWSSIRESILQLLRPES